MIHNDTIDRQLNHRTIRAFKDEPLTKDELTTLYQVASQTPTSNFFQQFSIIHVTDPQVRAQIRDIAKQKYVGANGDLLIFIVDLYRNQQIRQQLGNNDGRLHTMDVFMQAVEDTTLAVQNVLVAAESMGLGGVILGSIKNDPVKLIKVLGLPKMTMPWLGLQLGHPDQEPQLKPRLPLDLVAFEDHYPKGFKLDQFKDYDSRVTQYYDLRDTNKRIDSFTHQINGAKLNDQMSQRDDINEALFNQGLAMG